MSHSPTIPRSLRGHVPSQISRWRMRAMDRNRPLILVEGDTDKRLFDGIFNHPTKVDFPKGVRNNRMSVIAALQSLNQMNAYAVAGITDADYDRIKNQLWNISNLFYTDEHDMEMQIIMSDVFVRLMNNLCDPNRFSNYWSQISPNTDWISESRELILNLAIEIGYYRMAAYDLDPSVDFPPVDEQVCDLNLQIQSNFIKNDLAMKGLNRSQIESIYNHYRTTILGHHVKQIVRGHDAASLLAIAFKSIFAARTQITPKDIEEYLRTGYGYHEFSGSGLCSKLVNWATNNGISLNLRY